ncbi:hypothetical protein B0T21DRAFT_396243 [Apiosordaria backusii]|uniref:Ricin B lectin domain-containing protein n=1 Tax=Apiosordaria backusii TaxID=314023 RepID=A0AA40DV50_9PEZI|nr:hypothetical protein B0T21DRAFT_396243 [Apiosordaria backusii]
MASDKPFKNAPPDEFFGQAPEHYALPVHFGIYIIWDRRRGHVLSLKDGELRFTPWHQPSKHRAHWYWTCVEEGGWLSLKSPVSGQFITAEDDVLGVELLRSSMPGSNQRFFFREATGGGYRVFFQQDESLVVVQSVDEHPGQPRSPPVALEVAKQGCSDEDTGEMIWVFVRFYG